MGKHTMLRLGPLRFRDPVLLSRQATVRGSAFWAANLLTGAFNLLPIPPLDGTQMLASAAQLRAQKKSARNDCKNLHFRVK